MANDFLEYMLAQARRQSAYERYSYAAAALELASIKERLAEIRSQHEPLNGLIGLEMGTRDRLCAAAHYVVTGRLDTAAQRRGGE